MRTRAFVFLTLVAALVTLAVAPAASAQGSPAGFGCFLFTDLTPAEEVRPPDTTDPVQSRAFGFTWLNIRPNGEVRVTTLIVNPARETFVAGHIHAAPPGVNGPVVVPLWEGSTSNFVFSHSDVLTTTPALAADICANPRNYYVNYHTTQDPQGAVRGQLG